jgi:hypothetical protein
MKDIRYFPHIVEIAGYFELRLMAPVSLALLVIVLLTSRHSSFADPRYHKVSSTNNPTQVKLSLHVDCF